MSEVGEGAPNPQEAPKIRFNEQGEIITDQPVGLRAKIAGYRRVIGEWSGWLRGHAQRGFRPPQPGEARSNLESMRARLDSTTADSPKVSDDQRKD